MQLTLAHAITHLGYLMFSHVIITDHVSHLTYGNTYSLYNTDCNVYELRGKYEIDSH